MEKAIVNKSYNQNYNTIIFAVTATCENCYTKINKLRTLINNETKYKYVNVLIVVMGEYDNYRITSLLDLHKFNYIVDKGDELLKNNKYFSMNQIYVINANNEILLLGDLLSSKTMHRVFDNYIKR